MTSASTSPPQPPVSGPSSTTASRFVFSTERTIVSRSIGRIVRRSITSAETPCAASSSAAARRVVDALHRAHERDVGALAHDRGAAELEARAPRRPGPSASRAACARRRSPGCRRGSPPESSPFASAGVEGATIFRPVIPVSHEIGICEWIAPKRPPAPTTERITIGHAVALLGQEPVLRRLVDQAVHREREEVAEHDLEHRAAAR